MKNVWARHTVLLCIAFALSACASTRVDSMRETSQRMEDRSREFYSQVRYDGDSSYRDRVSRGALALSESSRDLNRAVERRADSNRIAVEYDKVARDYRRLQDDLTDAGLADQNRRVLEDFDRVTSAYRDLQSAFEDRRAATLDRRRD